MKNILVPTDLSKTSSLALKYAVDIARKNNANIHLLHVSFLPSFYVNSLDNYSLHSKELRNAIDRIKSITESKLKEFIKFSSVDSTNILSGVKMGYSVHDEILSYAEKLNPGLIIVGDHSERKGSLFKIGSNTERIIRTTQIPVLVVTKKTKIKRIKKVVFASDFEKNSVLVYSFLNKFIQPYNPEIHLLFINTKSNFKEYDDVKSKINIFKKKYAGKFKFVIRAAKNVDEGIIKYADSVNADLIALGVKRRTKLSLYMTDRITESVISTATIPVLAIDNPK